MNPIRTFIVLAFAMWLGSASAQVEIGRALLGSGEPETTGFENATAVTNDVYHAPQYLPGSPTAGTIYPRVLEVPCRTADNVLRCEGYHWSPRMGRAEYLFFTPVIVPAASARPAAQVQPVLPEPVLETVAVAELEPALELALTRSIATPPIAETTTRPRPVAPDKRVRH